MRQKVWIILLCACVLVGTAACGKTAEPAEEPMTFSETTETTLSYTLQLAGTYSSHIAMSETMGVDLYLQIGEDGSFVFARDTQFLTQEKGAGTVTENAFVYAVLNGEETGDESHRATYVTDEDGSIRFTSPMWFGATEPKITADDGSVSYPIFALFDGQTPETETQPTETQPQTADQSTTLPVQQATSATAIPVVPASATIAAKPNAAQTTRAATTAAPKSTTRSYMLSTRARTAQEDSSATTVKATTTTKPATTTTKPAATTTAATMAAYSGSISPVSSGGSSGSSSGASSDVSASAASTNVSSAPAESFREGVAYRGSTEKFVDAMNSTVHYDVSITFSGGQYTGTVQIRLSGGMEHSETQTYSGTYTRNGNALTMTGDFSKGTISGNSIDLTGKLSGFASASDSVTVTR